MPNDQHIPSSESATTQADEQDREKNQGELDLSSMVRQMVRDQFREYRVEARQVRDKVRRSGIRRGQHW